MLFFKLLTINKKFMNHHENYFIEQIFLCSFLWFATGNRTNRKDFMEWHCWAVGRLDNRCNHWLVIHKMIL